MMTKNKNKNQYHIFDYLSRDNVCSGFFSGKPHRNVTAINASIGKPKRILHNSLAKFGNAGHTGWWHCCTLVVTDTIGGRGGGLKTCPSEI